MNNYEIILILTENTSDLASLEQKIFNMFAKSNELQVKKWGLKKFAYPIKKQQQGYYYQINTKLSAADVTKLTPQFNLMKDVLRFLIINQDNEKHFRYKNFRSVADRPTTPKAVAGTNPTMPITNPKNPIRS